MWKHYPDSPFGDVEICEHACTKPVGETGPVCVECDYPADHLVDVRNCKECQAGTWHDNGICIRCGSVSTSLFLGGLRR